jgi:hypothetical protein
MTKKHFIEFARIIKAQVDAAQPAPGGIKTIDMNIADDNARFAAEMVAKVALADNPRFNKARFFAACGLN